MKESVKIKEEWYKDDHKLLGETKSNKVEKLFELYAKDKYVARVIYMNDSNNYENFKLFLFTKSNGDFTIVLFRKKYGISKSSTMYNHEKRLLEVIYKEGKFYLVDNTTRRSGLLTLTLTTLTNACMRANMSTGNGTKLHNKICSVLETRFSWIKFLNETNTCTNVAFNTIISNKIYNLKKALTHQYKTNYPTAKLLDKMFKSSNSYTHNLVKALPTYMPYIINIESLKEEWFKGDFIDLFHDSLKMAKTLDMRVNASWTTRRLKEEHDKWAKIISDIVFIAGNRDMKIGKLYKDFSEHSGYELITTTKDMAYEGKRQNHCVASYVNKVENGSCAIVRSRDYTMELKTTYFKSTAVIMVTQTRGYGNSFPTDEFQKELSDRVVAFNKLITNGEFVETMERRQYELVGNIYQDLPF